MTHAEHSSTAPGGSAPGSCRILRVCPAKLEEAVAEAAQALAAGGLVAFPTETVYGLGAKAERTGAAKLASLKGRDRSKPIALLLSRFDLAGRSVSEVSATARRLADAFCPGPITLVLPARGGGTVGVRVPDHEVALALVRACGGALYATSANLSGQPPARSAEEVAAAFPRGLDLIVDGGAVAIGTASTVVRVDGDRWEILRTGALSEQDLAAALSTASRRRET